jgi:gliding motility-associated-like protein
MKKLLLSFFLLTTAAIAFAQAPNISYSSPQMYVAGKTIANLVPVNSGGAVPATAYSQVTTLAGNGSAGFVDGTGAAARFRTPYAIANDAAGNIYVVDYGNNVIRKVTPAGVVTTIVTGLSNPGGIAVDAAGNLYIADTGNQVIKKVTAAGVESIYAGSGNLGFANGPAATATFKNPQDVAVDAAGNVYVADYGNNQIRKITTAGIVSVLAGNGASGFVDGTFAVARFRNPFGVAVDAAGNVYVADFNNSAVRKVTPGGVVSTLAGNGTAGFADANGSSARFDKPGDVAVDALGNVYVTDSYNSLVRRINPAGDVTTFAGNVGNFARVDGIGTNAVFGFPEGITIDDNGNLYTADYGTSVIRKALTRGYYIDKVLPAGLSFDPTTGIISGTPTDVSPATDYKISAYNANGESSFTVSIGVRNASDDATLSALTSSTGALTPVFAPTTKRYIINVPNSTTSITVTPTLSDLNAVLKLNGVTHVSGTPSTTIALSVGNTDIPIQVIAESDTTIINYLVSVVRAKVAVAAPNITYTTPNSYTVNLPIPTLGPANTGGAVPANSYSAVNTIATGITNPVGIAADAAGNVYVADNTQIRKITPAGTVSLFADASAGFVRIGALTADGQGNILVADAGDNKIRMINPGGIITIVAGHSGDYSYKDGIDTTARFANPSGVATDPSGNVFVADFDNNLLRKISLDQQVSTLAGSGSPGSANGNGGAASFRGPVSVTTDAAGNIYVADKANNTIRKVTPGGSVTTFAGSGTPGATNATGTAASFDTPSGVATDVAGNVYVVDAANSKVRKITPAGEVTNLAGSGYYQFSDGIGRLASFNYPLGIASDNNGHLFVADYGNSAVRKIQITGYVITPTSLPAGLVFDPKTGVISGTPTAKTAKKTYTITGYNEGGSSASTLDITITAPSTEARLRSLLVNTGNLIPLFKSATMAYTVNVTKNNIIVTPTGYDLQATIKINGVDAVNGADSAPIPLNLGSNLITIDVTAPDGVTIKTYTVDVTRNPGSSNANLSALIASTGAISPSFAAGTLNYTASVSNATTQFTLTPTTSNANATVQVNGVDVLSGNATAAIPLNVGLNVITTIVTAENGTGTKTYTLRITRAPSTNADLADIGLSDGTLTPTFAVGTLAYTASVPNGISDITVTPTTVDAASTVKVNGVTVVSGAASAAIPLNAGPNNISVVVTAEDGTTLKTYTVTVTRAASSNSDLSSLALSQGVLSPAFGSGILVYSASVSNAITSLQVTPAIADAGATIKVNGIDVTSGTPSGPIVLSVGPNVITTVVTAADGVTAKTYTVNIARQASGNANLSNLVLSTGALTPVFNAATLSYSSSVINTVTSTTVTPTTADAAASIQVNGANVVSGTASADIVLNEGSNVITTVVTAEDGTIKTYTTTVTRALSTDANLSALSISEGTLSPVFAPGIMAYTSSVPNSTTGITIMPTSENANAAIKVNGVAIVSGTASSVLPLTVGSNNLTVQLTAQDGVTITTYTITVTRAASAVSSLSSLTASAGAISPVFDPATLTYSVSVSNTVTGTTITAAATEPNATIKVNGVAVNSATASGNIALNVGSNAIVTSVTAQDGVTVTSYTINITRAPSADADLAGLTLSAGILNPAFASGTLAYTSSVGNAVTATTLTPTVNEATATVTVNGVAVTSGTASAPINLVVGLNTIPVNVTAGDGVTVKNYIVRITRAASADANLSALITSAGALSPAFNAANGSYTVTVTNANSSITVTPTQNDANASITVNGTAVASGSPSQALPLLVGGNIINVVVTAQDGTTKTYTITANRQPSGNALLTALVPSAGTLNPAFAGGTNTYTVAVNNTITSINFTPTLSDATAAVTVNGVAVASGAASQGIGLVVGVNTVTVAVTAQNGTVNNYKVDVTRAPSIDQTLSNLIVSGASLSPAFTRAGSVYTAAVGNNVTSVTITPTVNESHATVTVNGVPVVSGTASGAIPLAVGNTVISTVVTAEDGGSNKIYQVTITRAQSSDATLSALTISSGTLSPTFVSGVTGYTAHVGNAVASITVTPTNNDANAVIRVNGNLVSGGSASAAIPLVVGNNSIAVQVTAQDGTLSTYTIDVIKAAPVASTDANLTALAVSTGTLTPAFAQGTLAYTVSVPNATTSIAVTPTSSEAHATITVNGTTVASGAASAGIPLNAGANVITTIITAEDGTTNKTYTITVTRAPSANNNLANISLSTGTLSPAFAQATTTYTASVGNAITSVQLTPTTAVNTATVKVNGVTVASGSASTAIPLLVGPNVITTVVTAQNGVTKSYAVTVTRAASPNADLANLTLSAGTLSPVFAAATTDYTAAVGNATTTIKLTPTVADATASVKVNGVIVASGSASAAISLLVGPNDITTVVTAQDGTPKTYTVTVTRAKSSNANLSNLVLSAGTLNPVFASGTISYTATVSNAVSTFKITPTVADATATVTVDGVTVASGTASTAVALAVGPNVISTVVTAEDGTTKTYIVQVDRAKSPNADLAGLSISDGALSPAFVPGTINYTASVPNATAGITLTATVSEPNATLQVNGAAVASGSPSANIPLVVGPNMIATQVTAQDGTIKTYTVTVTRAPSPDATLSNLSLSAGTLTPGFASATNTYTASVGNAVTSVKITPTVNEPNAAVKVNGTTLTSGSASAAIPLVVGPNVITTIVTAQDGTSTQTYTTTVTRAPSSNAFLTALGVSSGFYSPSFGTNIFDYTMLVTNNVTAMSITPVLADNTATITVNGLPVTSGVASAPVVLAVGNNFIRTVVTAQDGVTVKTYTVIVNRALSSENDLSNLTISTGPLTPGFQSGINGYTASVSNTTTSLTVKPTVADVNATVKVNNVAVVSGTSSGPVNLTVGPNNINVIVTAQNGLTNTYTVVVTRAASANADLANLTANTGTLSPAFTPNTISYSGTAVNNSISSIQLTPITSDATASITVNGITVASGSASPDIPLNVGANSIPVVVKAQAGNTKTYTVSVSRLPSANADLAGITLSGGSLSPAFAPGITDYTAIISNADAGITVTPNTSDATATVTVNGTTVTPGTPSASIPLVVGDNTIKVVVKAQDGTIKTYVVVATREASSNADLVNLSPSAGTLSPTFLPATQGYTISVQNDVVNIHFTPTVADATATVKVQNTIVASGTASTNMPLVLGQNTFNILVTAQDGITSKPYVVTVTREKSTNADLSNLTSNAGTLSPVFTPGTTAYLINVSNQTQSATLTPTISDANATIEILGQQLSSGVESPAVQLGLGDNEVDVVVTAQDGSTVKTYKVTIHRAFSNDATLGNLQLSAGTLSPAFSAGMFNYVSTVPYTDSRIRITPSLNDGTASVTVNGTPVANGSASGFVDLVVGTNTIVVEVTAADGTKQPYTIVVTRDERLPSTDASLTSLFLTQGELSPAFNRDNLSYTATVQSSVNKTNVVAIVSDPNATITVNGVPVTSGSSSGDILLADGANQIFVRVTAEDGTTTKPYNIVITKANFAASLPNVFTPNGDGTNDLWILPNINLYPDCTVKIFNRGGQQVFNSVGYSIAWDGTFNGKTLPPDTYYYIIDLKHGQGVRSGSVSIIR